MHSVLQIQISNVHARLMTQQPVHKPADCPPGPLRRLCQKLSHYPRLRLLTETNMLAALLLAVAFVYGFMELADEVLENETQGLDERILMFFRRSGDLHETIGPWWLKAAALDITALGGTAVLVVVILITLGFLWIAKKKRIMLLFAAATFGGQVFNSVLKQLFMRPRPTVVPHLTEVQSSSFPSGHSMMSAIVYLTLGVLLSRLVTAPLTRFYIIAVSILLTAMVGFTRVFLGVHYPTDVVGGWTVGLAWAVICLLVARILQHKGTVEKPQEHTQSIADTPH